MLFDYKFLTTLKTQVFDYIKNFNKQQISFFPHSLKLTLTLGDFSKVYLQLHNSNLQ